MSKKANNVSVEFQMILKDHEKRILKLEELIHNKDAIKTVDKNNKIEKFYNKKRPINDFQTLAVLGFYLEFIENKDEFTIKDLINAWERVRLRNVKEKAFKIIINNALNIYKYFISGSEKGSYKISRIGKQVVDNLPELIKK